MKVPKAVFVSDQIMAGYAKWSKLMFDCLDRTQGFLNTHYFCAKIERSRRHNIYSVLPERDPEAKFLAEKVIQLIFL